jgi:hypothetical protein
MRLVQEEMHEIRRLTALRRQLDAQRRRESIDRDQLGLIHGDMHRQVVGGTKKAVVAEGSVEAEVDVAACLPSGFMASMWSCG